MHHKWMYGDCGKTFSDGTTLRQAAHQAHVSLQTALLWKRKMQRMPENASDKVLSGDVWVDHAYINAPMSRRKGKKKRGLSRQLMQVAVGIDSQGGVLLRLGSRGLAGTGDSMDAFLGHVAPGSIVYHDMGHFSGCFPGCTARTFRYGCRRMRSGRSRERVCPSAHTGPSSTERSSFPESPQKMGCLPT